MFVAAALFFGVADEALAGTADLPTLRMTCTHHSIECQQRASLSTSLFEEDIIIDTQKRHY